MSSTSAFSPGSFAIVTGAASGIGLAAALRLAALGMRVVLADLPGERLDAALGKFDGVGEAMRRRSTLRTPLLCARCDKPCARDGVASPSSWPTPAFNQAARCSVGTKSGSA